MYLKRETRIGAAVALVAVLALASAAPAQAAGWPGWDEAREWSGGIVLRMLGWLGRDPVPVVTSNCDDGAHIDPNGCPRKWDHGSQIDPDGLRTKADDGASIDPNGQH